MKKNISKFIVIFSFLFSIAFIISSFNINNAKADDVISCSKDVDCPIGRCLNGKEYPQYSCLNGNCNSILYFVDPCLDLSSSSSGSSVSNLSKNFAGIWRGSYVICPVIDPPFISPDDQCIVCPQVISNCKRGFTIVPQSCSSCAHCLKCQGAELATFKICVKDNSISGYITIGSLVQNAQITSSEVISKNSIKIKTTDVAGNELTISLTLDKNRLILGQIEGFGQNFITLRKVKQNKTCSNNSSNSTSSTTSSGCLIPACAAPPEGCIYEMDDSKDKNGCPLNPCGKLICSSSGLISDCDSKGSCRGENGAELACPSGTQCSGLPAYGCYPPNCAVPICLSEKIKILTPKGYQEVRKLKKGDYVISDNGEPAYILETRKARVYNHTISRVELDDGTILEVSPGHPTGPTGIKVGSLKSGYKLDGRTVLSNKFIPYEGKYTYDILPNSLTGNYYANGVLIGSSLYKTTLIMTFHNW